MYLSVEGIPSEVVAADKLYVIVSEKGSNDHVFWINLFCGGSDKKIKDYFKIQVLKSIGSST